MTWELITVPDEADRCCVVQDGQRCERATEFEVRGAGGEPDDYAFTCADHVELVVHAGDLVLRVAEPSRPRLAAVGRSR